MQLNLSTVYPLISPYENVEERKCLSKIVFSRQLGDNGWEIGTITRQPLHDISNPTSVIEVEVHQQLRAFLRQQGQPYWSHYLTMGRLVARALRLGRSALIQTGVPPVGHHGRYRLSYLVSALVWQESAILVVPEAVQQRLLLVEIPQIRQWMQTSKPIHVGDRWLPDFQGLMITSPTAWLNDRLGSQDRFPPGIPVIIDGADDLETWVQQQLTISLQPQDWNQLMLAFPTQTDRIRDAQIHLTRAIYQRPQNPYDQYLLDAAEQVIIQSLVQQLEPQSLLPEAWQAIQQRLLGADVLFWATVQRDYGQFALYSSPVEVASVLEPIWTQQPVVLIGSALDLDSNAAIARQRLGLPEMTCLKFAPDRHHELIQLYLPERMPLPNTSQYQAALVKEIRYLLYTSAAIQNLTVLIVDDTPLKAQVGSLLAAEFGSRVQVEKTCLEDNGILVTGWEFWRQHQAVLPLPKVMAIATLPIPSLEHPLVAGRVAYYKRQRQDWFRLYLLPTALSELQRAIAPLRESQGVVALLDSRVIHRSYGQQILTALSPLARLSYLDETLFSQSEPA